MLCRELSHRHNSLLFHTSASFFRARLFFHTLQLSQLPTNTATTNTSPHHRRTNTTRLLLSPTMKTINRDFGSAGTKLALSRKDYAAPYDPEDSVAKVESMNNTTDTEDNALTGKTEHEGDAEGVEVGSAAKGDGVWEALELRWLVGVIVDRVKGNLH
jgi:hypothetical protein